ncbi:MAG: hypothetical protein A2092_15245 [Rhodobacteraceae bacterium GWE1_64_9]|nr:MAG: hypothetical protein A2092_15245 [Rhodobacteraceae bacterium GWE1_64_9]OHC50569.1 MAG: hypothetical protein A2X69_08340 [Rhodobacteraceae bacterium GWF1_65_7]HBD91095.1 hypothetical protein [Gemmobacter sp.]HBU13976.1 hypothetical protein [Gemmobacter sp.]
MDFNFKTVFYFNSIKIVHDNVCKCIDEFFQIDLSIMRQPLVTLVSMLVSKHHHFVLVFAVTTL